MTPAPDTSPEAVERICTVIDSIPWAAAEVFEAALLLRALSGELAKSNAAVAELIDDSAKVAQDNIALRGELARARVSEAIDRVTCLDAANFGLDEVVAHGAFVHLERLDKGHFFLSVSAGGEEWRFWLHSPKTISVTHEHDGLPLQQAGRRAQGPSHG